MVWRLALCCSLAVLLVLQAPARADGLAPGAPSSPAPAARAGGSRNAALVALVAGGALAVTAVFFGVRARREMNSDDGLAEGAIASVALFIAVPTLVVGIGLMLPDDPNARPSSTYPRVAQLPSGLALRLTF